jgi:hypothetical protein
MKCYPILAGMIGLLFGCTPEQEEGPIVEMPPEPPAVEDTGMGWLEGDSGLFDTGFNEPFLFTLDVTHQGSWIVSPPVNPEFLTGEMTITEIAEEDTTNPWCSFTYQLAGEDIPNTGCPTCEYVFNIEFYILDYDETPDDQDDMDAPMTQANLIEDCLLPDLPDHGEYRQLGWSFVEQTIYYNYENSGLWIPWYSASEIADEVIFSWESRVGFYGFPDDN